MISKVFIVHASYTFVLSCTTLSYATLSDIIFNFTVLNYTVPSCIVLHCTARTALAEKGMTAEQYDKLTEMQRIKPKDDEEAKVIVAPILPLLCSLVLCCVVLCCVVFFSLSTFISFF